MEYANKFLPKTNHTCLFIFLVNIATFLHITLISNLFFFCILMLLDTKYNSKVQKQKYIHNIMSMEKNELFERLKSAHNINGIWKEMLPISLYRLLKPYSRCRVIPMDYLFFPFISASGGCCQQSQVILRGGWKQPSILWTLVLAPSGFSISIFFPVLLLFVA